jgi:hypothetical protein
VTDGGRVRRGLARPLLALALLSCGLARAQPAERPFRAFERVGVPWLRFGLEHRARVEHLANDFRHERDSTGLLLRTLVSAEVRVAAVVGGAELQDARGWFSADTPLNTTLVNPLEPLQAYVGLRLRGVVEADDALSVSVGRLTLDVGSRRLVARNEFRNTINGFTGLDAQWASGRADVVRAFVAAPVTRRPAASADLASARVELDRENVDALVWGVFAQSRPLRGRVQLDAALLGLHERDGEVASANRQLVTQTLRVLRGPVPGELDFQLEVMAQLGRSCASAAPADVTTLLHAALGAHAEVGLRLAAPLVPRAAVVFDFASGDADPTDGVNGRFDPLFGARRFDLTPTSLWGALPRSNLASPGLKVELQPHARVEASAGWRLALLASATDAWVVTGLRDPTGAAGGFLGQQGDVRLRWHVFPRNLLVEVNGALLVPGPFLAATAGRRVASAWVSTQVVVTL